MFAGLLTAYLAAVALDLKATHACLSAHRCVERNGLTSAVMAHGMGTTIAVRAGTTGAAVALTWQIRRHAPKAGMGVMVGLLAMQTAVDVATVRAGR